MKQKLQKILDRAKSYWIVVEGKHDAIVLKELGFEKIFQINQTGKSLYELIEKLSEICGKDKICILTDFDKAGRKLYKFLKRELVVRGARLDNSLRHELLKAGLTHIEGLQSFLENAEKAG